MLGEKELFDRYCKLRGYPREMWYVCMPIIKNSEKYQKYLANYRYFEACRDITENAIKEKESKNA